MSEDLPRIISYPSKSPFEGKFITINEKENLGLFEIKRIYWINYSSSDVTLSEHAHKNLNQIIIAISGSIKITLEDIHGKTYQFELNNSEKGLYIPSLYWKKLEYASPCILLCLASESYNENDYIRTYKAFKEYQK